MTFVIVGGHGVVPGSTTIIYDSELSDSSASETNTPVMTSATIHTPIINVPTATTSSNNALLAVAAAVSAHRKLMNRGSRCLSVDGMLLFNSGPIELEEEVARAMGVEAVDTFHGKDSGYTAPLSSVPEDPNDAEEFEEDRVSTEVMKWTVDTNHTPSDNFNHQYKLVGFIKPSQQEHHGEGQKQNQIYDNSMSFLADYLTCHPGYSVPAANRMAEIQGTLLAVMCEKQGQKGQGGTGILTTDICNL